MLRRKLRSEEPDRSKRRSVIEIMPTRPRPEMNSRASHSGIERRDTSQYLESGRTEIPGRNQGPPPPPKPVGHVGQPAPGDIIDGRTAELLEDRTPLPRQEVMRDETQVNYGHDQDVRSIGAPSERGQDRKGKGGWGFREGLKAFAADLAPSRSDGLAYGGHYQAESKEERYRRERDQLREDVDRLSLENGQFQAQVQILNDQLKAQSTRVERVKRGADQIQTELENKQLFLGVQATDEEITQQYAALVGEIKTWSARFRGESNASPFQAERLQEYLRTAPYHQTVEWLDNVTRDKKKRRAFVRGISAAVMCDALIRTLPDLPSHQGSLRVDTWLDPATAKAFHTLELRLCSADSKAVATRAFNDWRGLTADSLSSIEPTNDAKRAEVDAVRFATKQVMDVVSFWAGPNELLDLEAGLEDIFLKAVQFSKTLRKQRALWSIRYPQRPMNGALMFDINSMDDEQDDIEDVKPDELRRYYVELVLTPALFKRGNSKGERFEIEHCAVPAKVLLLPPRPLTQRT